MLIQLKRLLESGFLSVHGDAWLLSDGFKETPDIIAITKEGRDFISELGDHEL